ncbi:secretory pathway Sec39 [Lojkania enalia]|uniref:Secretory pathway Sec39 n=1 Tax=Lojkania enalia TaxID=147567 RepID=A0A9P4K564_9PLEO|nr:secretory pathway Sec39 [Didymosphaeria enalia]
MAELEKLSAPQCVLLAVQYATESNIPALWALTTLREQDLELEQILRILLTFLPESTDPSHYIGYLNDLVTDARSFPEDQSASWDSSSVGELSNSQARKRAHKLPLLSLTHPLYRGETSLDAFTLFLIHRSHRIDAETGILSLVAELVAPFLHHSDYLRIWFISSVLPLLRLGYEYYPQNPIPSLETFVRLKGERAIESQLSSLRQPRSDKETKNPALLLRGVVGPWMCGANERKRRKLDVEHRRRSSGAQRGRAQDDWECLFSWMVRTSKEDFALVASAITEWDGPEDIDLGGFDEGHVYIDEDYQRLLELRYAQAAMASVYLVENNVLTSVQTSHSILSRLNTLLNFDPPQSLNAGLESLPSYDLSSPILQDSTTTVLQDEHIMELDNPITQPDRKAIRLLELFVFSACLLASLQHPMSVRDVARLYLRNDHSEQLTLLQKILHLLSSGPKLDIEQWKATRSTLLWLWNWGARSRGDGVRHGQGILGFVEEKRVHVEIFKALLESGHYVLASQTYIEDSAQQRILPLADVEGVILESVMHCYDNASNGNRTRGGMKRASDIIAAFVPHFSSSTRFQRFQALLSATHKMSYYSLILQHGVPFQPVNIRVNPDPLSLLPKLLSQNEKSYTHLDDLISIGQDLVIAMPSTLMDEGVDVIQLDPTTIQKKKSAAERRVIGMAIEAALQEDDFETAYSYVVNRLSPPSSPLVSPAASMSSRRFSLDSNHSAKHSDEAEDIAWRAALTAGRHESSPATSAWSGVAARSDLRRLEQRMELLSRALLLAPPSHLEEVLGVWQQCEGEMTKLLAEEAAEEERHNTIADQRLPGAFANETVTVQPRREVGRGAAEEAPMGLFDVARGAAAAFSKSAFPLRGTNVSTSRTGSIDLGGSQGRLSMDHGSDSESIGGAEDGNKVRKRDMVASAVTGGLASGIGWVLGAKPIQDHERE